ncbi:MAG: cupin domain-containing protein [Hyphomonadaceae bacterium]|nr:cupin domain-containing protein [Hyphomonadaceae bacterium]
MTLHDNAYAAFMLDYAAGVLTPAERLAADLHRALSPEGGRNAHVLEAVGGAILERIGPLPTRYFDTPRLGSQEASGNRSSLLDPYLNRDLLALNWRKDIFGVKTLPTSIPTASLLRLDPSERAPSHLHGRRDVTVVLLGAYADEFGAYERGDIAFAEPGLKHQPRAEGDKPCVCLLATEAGRPLQGFLGLFGLGDSKPRQVS